MMQPNDLPSDAFIRYEGGIKVKFMSEIQGTHGPLYGFGTSPVMSESVETRWKATVIATEDTWLAKLSKQDFERIENNLIKQHSQDCIHKLWQYSFLNEVSDKALAKLYHFLDMKYFTWGSVVYNKGDPVDGIWMIVEGEFHHYNIWNDTTMMTSHEKLGEHS